MPFSFLLQYTYQQDSTKYILSFDNHEQRFQSTKICIYFIKCASLMNLLKNIFLANIALNNCFNLSFVSVS